MPDGPGAAPLRALRIQIRRSLWNSTCDFRRQRFTSCGRSPFPVPQLIQCVPVAWSPNSQLLQPGCCQFGVSSCGFVPMQPDWKHPCCRRSTTSIVLRRTSGTWLPTFPWDQPSTARAAQQHAREEKEELPSSLLLLLITMFLTCGNLLQSHVQCALKRPLKKKGTVLAQLMNQVP